jgi:hypothetical protein
MLYALPPARLPPVVERAAPSFSMRFASGRQTATARLREPTGVILLYRVRAPVGVRIEARTRLPSITAPLMIATPGTGRPHSCTSDGLTSTCVAQEEWCPMPRGVWRLSVRKLSGPAARVTIWFRVGEPPPNQAA